MKSNRYIFVFYFLMVIPYQDLMAQSPEISWIRPANAKSPATWGIRNGIVFSIWPTGLEGGKEDIGGPRGLIRIGYENSGKIYLINFLAIEPMVNGEIEYSEISPSVIDNQWGKLMWAGENGTDMAYFQGAKTRGILLHPDSLHIKVEELSVYIFLEKFRNGAHPYLRLSIRNDNPGELGIEIFNHNGSSLMQRCAVSATMGNYSRLRNIYLKHKVLRTRELYKGYDEIDFIEKESYSAAKLWKAANGDLVAIAESDEDFKSLSSWPQEQNYLDRLGWRYRPNLKLSQYWRKDGSKYDHSLVLRVNGRSKYWSLGSRNKQDYVNIPGGPSFENFELRENYYSGQKFYYGITKKTAQQFLKEYK
jgi:hypothetical protein